MPWDFSSIQCIHGGVNPNRGGDCTLISEQAFEKIHIDPSTPFPDIEVCPVCVEAEYEQLKWSGNLAEAVCPARHDVFVSPHARFARLMR